MKHDIHFEEGIFDGEGRFERIEIPISQKVLWGAFFVAIIASLVVFGRVAVLNVFQKDRYLARAVSNVNKEIKIPANRGLIVDRFGEILVKNIPTFSVSLDTADLFNHSETVEGNIEKVASVLDLPAEGIKSAIRKVDLERVAEVIIAPDISLEKAIKLKSLQLEAFHVKDAYRRFYPDISFAHLLGYSGVADEGDSIVGKTGLEAVYDQQLRGVDGVFVKKRDVRGEILEEKLAEQMQPGHQLNTTIDAGLQRYFYRRFKEGLETLGRTRGAGIVLNPKTGEILSLLSFPEYDNNNPVDYLRSGDRALFNRVVSGVYSPGSAIKPFFALAALRENIVQPTDSFYSKGFLEIPNPYFPDKPSRFLDWKAHGYVDLYSALARSSNVYFYIVGGGWLEKPGLGIRKLLEYWDRFHLGKKTGVDLLSEKEGFFYGPEERESLTGDIWRIGNTYNVSIGQGDLAVTPLRLLTSFTAFANNGASYKPFVAANYIDERENLVIINKPEVEIDLGDWQKEIHEVRKGLRDAVSKSYGTANILADLPITVSGKTGSAQISNNTKTNAFFIGYAPADDPEIAVLVMIEDAREGSLNTLPIAHGVFQWYYWNRFIKKSE